VRSDRLAAQVPLEGAKQRAQGGAVHAQTMAQQSNALSIRYALYQPAPRDEDDQRLRWSWACGGLPGLEPGTSSYQQNTAVLSAVLPGHARP
jgi:hypothetical protein